MGEEVFERFGEGSCFHLTEGERIKQIFFPLKWFKVN